MKNFLIFEGLSIQGANSVSGLLCGFPSISHFLGFCHALSLKLKKKHEINLFNCAIFCHDYELKERKYEKYKEPVFLLNRKPLKKDGKNASFIEEGKMNLKVSLIVECSFCLEQKETLESLILFEVLQMRLAGGDIFKVEKIYFENLPNDKEEYDKKLKKILYKMLPSFVLLNRVSYLEQYHLEKLKENSTQQILDSWLDFWTLRYHAIKNPENDFVANWERMNKPFSGFLVPICVGFEPISEILPNTLVKQTRDSTTPFCFVEQIYSIGEWINPIKIDSTLFLDIFWEYTFKNNTYFFYNMKV